MISLALIGQGVWGKNYIRAITKIPDCSLPRENIRTRDYEILLKNSTIDGVIIATPASTHFEIAKKFLEKGQNLLIEKPFTTSLYEALELKREQRDAVLMVGHIFRYNPYFKELQKQISKMGTIKKVTSEGMNSGPYRSDISALWDYAPHDISMLSALFGAPNYVSAVETGEKPGDSFSLHLTFQNNIHSISKVSRASINKKRTLSIFGEDRELLFDDTAEKKLRIKIFSENRELYLNISDKTPLENELLEFIDCIKTKRKPVTGIDDAIESIKILEAAEESLKQKGKEIGIN